MEIGLISTHWAYLEFLLEIGIWWVLGLLNRPVEGRIITGSLSIEVLATKLRDLAHLRFKDHAEIELFASVAARIKAVATERNLAVHGVRAATPDNSFTAMVGRGPYKGAPQNIPLVRLRSVTSEIRAILAELEPVLHRNGIITSVGVLP